MPDKSDPFLFDIISRWTLCRFCRHLHKLLGRLTCSAFPQGIPREIVSGELIHNEPLPEQGNDLSFIPW